MEKKLLKKLNYLTIYAFASTLFLACMFFYSFRDKDKKESFDELNVKRINIVGEDGSLRLVISNETRQHPGRVNGTDLPKRERPAGIIFFNNKGDECGGIIADVSEKDTVNSGMSFTMDNYHNDQVVQILNDETYGNGNEKIQRGLIVNEFPPGSDLISTFNKLTELKKIKDEKEQKDRINDLLDKEGSKRRLFVGRNTDNNTGLFLYDTNGKPRLKIYVDKEGNARMETVDSNGKTKSIIANN